MIKATSKDKPLVVDILSAAFDTNKSINYIIPQDKDREKRIRKLMEYSFDVCHAFGETLLSEDKKACALVIYPDKKKTTLQSVLWDVSFATSCVGVSGIKRVLDRESKIKTFHPKDPFYYLWFIGVHPNDHNKGKGTQLMKDIIKDSSIKNRRIYLETSTTKNVPWYQKFGFEVFNELDLSYKLYFLRNKLN